MDSAHFFGQGFFGLEAENVTFLTTDDFDDPVSWLKPWEVCQKMSHHESTVGTPCYDLTVPLAILMLRACRLNNGRQNIFHPS